MSLVPPKEPPKDFSTVIDETIFKRKITRGRWFIKHYVGWCPHCQHLAPIWADLSIEYHNKDFPIQFGQIDCEAARSLCDDHKVMGYPTLQLFQDGKLETEFQGLPTKGNLVKFLEENKEPRTLEDEPEPTPTIKENQLAPSLAMPDNIANTPIPEIPTPATEPTIGVEMPPPQPTAPHNPSTLAMPDYIAKPTATADAPESIEENPHIDRTIPLTDGNFTQAVEHGIWVIRHTSKKNPPPGRFHILWSQLTNDFSEFKKHLGFRFGTVDCDTEDILCEKNHIETHPTIQLWENGQYIENYPGKLDYESLAKYIRGIQSRKIDVTEFGSYQFPGIFPPNPEGTIDKLSSTSFTSMTSDGNWLLYYTSSTCQTCRPLGNVMEEVAAKLKNKVNVASFDCTKELEACVKHGVPGFPYIKFIKDGISKVYTGPPVEEKLIKFAIASSSPNFHTVNATNWKNINRNEEQYFIYAYGSRKELEDFGKLKDTFAGLYLSTDVYLVDKKIATPTLDSEKVPNFFVKKPHVEPIPFEGSLTSNQQLLTWLKENHYPTLIPLGSENFDAVLANFNYMVLGIVDPSKDHFNLERMKEISDRLSRDSTIASKKVGFGWLDGLTHLDYIQTLGRSIDDLPFMVIIQPKENKVFSKLEDQAPFKFEEKVVQNALNALGENQLKPDQLTGAKGVFSGLKVLPSEGEAFSGSHMVGLLLLAFALGFMYFLLKGRFRRKKRQLE